ncbi:hypothetical protein DACRYDRAFT_93140 [Dacryopinax primogenitus]|uniref:DNA-directed DNA polymerase n=1 Tax=Dacryopinax primogenitus (strain DJM 731) TaxID=1858805 RepID=M5GG09_DACPD|nr:uncharacterized protein DACRYDRAFT_93140 [Dacryopinax primogenitus]EJU04668.1 hypothetical protein DACRYDRAFT_93140 [Dacryopinax primogenitus]
MLRRAVEQRAREKWSSMEGEPKYCKRVLDVQKGELCFIIGTIYMDMPLKPNVLEDISKDHWIAAPPPRPKIFSPDDSVMLEDESGRVRLVGERVSKAHLVTGVIMGALGAETAKGDFEVVDVCFAGMPPQTERAEDGMDVDGEERKGEWVALVSGLDIGGSSAPADMRVQLLVEYLTSELGGEEDEGESARISRLILAGNSLTPPIRQEEISKKRYGYDSSSYSATPTLTLSSHLLDLSRTMPVHLMPGASDPAGATLPQQALPKAMFGEVRRASGFSCETNPCWIPLEGCLMLGVGGQTIDDIFKYVDSSDRLEMARSTLLWRHIAPTAPDTLWCHPFADKDPFIIPRTPDVYFVGNQPAFETGMVRGVEGQRSRVILLPRFSKTGKFVLVHTGTLEVKTLTISLEGWEEAESVCED